MKLFDSVDFVIVEGEANLLPWSNKCDKFAWLFKMCKLTNKWSFWSGFGLNMLVYYWATGFVKLNILDEKQINNNTVNSNSSFKLPSKEIQSKLILEKSTGDYYSFRQDLGLWINSGNVGLHWSKTTSSDNNYISKSRGNVQTASRYSTKEVIKSKITERKWTLKKEYFHHWLVQGIEKEFVITNESLWDSHPKVLGTSSLYGGTLSIIVESNNGPELIEHLNTIAGGFQVTEKYETTVTLLTNFINIKFEEIIERGRVDMILEEGENWARSMLYSKRLSQLKTKGTEEKEIKTRENPLFSQFNSTGCNKIEQNKEAVRPITATSKYSVFSTKNASTRGSSRPSKRAESAFTRRKDSARSRIYSAKPQSEFEFKSTLNTQSQTALNADEKARQEFYSNVITPSEQQSLTKENK